MMTEQRKPRVVAGHRITWWVYGWNHEGRGPRMRHTSRMRGPWGWDATCECGWDSRTGGATRGSVESQVFAHKFDVTGDWRQL